jgi:mono/diheme cytochrome c family protein
MQDAKNERIDPLHAARTVLPRLHMSMVQRIAFACFAATLSAGCATEPGQPGAQPTHADAPRAMADLGRGKLLYDNACAACHGEQVHWRDLRLVRDWSSLTHEVARWAEISGQRWSGEEIEDVATYLNTEIYRMPCPVPGCLRERIGARQPAVGGV